MTLNEKDSVKQQLEDITLLRKQISHMLRSVDEYMRGNADCSYQWGEKENALSVLVKLSGVISKIIPLEQELRSQFGESEGEEQKLPVPTTEEDKAIIKRYIDKLHSTQST